ncbi:hypothetical protein OIU76_026534 [Salix suchowensis]|nr:hypothetical protein OIU76_026534 [Salix suchowensis]
MLTSSISRLSYARILVEIDLLTNLSHTISISLFIGSSLKQPIIYETLPKFCKHCKVTSHNTSFSPQALGKNEKKIPMVSKGVSAPNKAKVKRWVPIKEVISGRRCKLCKVCKIKTLPLILCLACFVSNFQCKMKKHPLILMLKRCRVPPLMSLLRSSSLTQCKWNLQPVNGW